MAAPGQPAPRRRTRRGRLQTCRPARPPARSKRREASCLASAPATPASSRNRRQRNVTTTAAMATPANSTCTSPASTRPGQCGRHDSGHRRGGCPRIGGVSNGGNRNRPGEGKPGDDQPDNVARMPVAGRRQQAAPVLHGRRRWSGAGFRRLGHDFSRSCSQHDTQPARWRGRCGHARQNSAIGVQSGSRVAGGMITIPSPGRCPTRSATAPSRGPGSASGPRPARLPRPKNAKPKQQHGRPYPRSRGSAATASKAPRMEAPGGCPSSEQTADPAALHNTPFRRALRSAKPTRLASRTAGLRTFSSSLPCYST